MEWSTPATLQTWTDEAGNKHVTAINPTIEIHSGGGPNGPIGIEDVDGLSGQLLGSKVEYVNFMYQVHTEDFANVVAALVGGLYSVPFGPGFYYYIFDGEANGTNYALLRTTGENEPLEVVEWEVLRNMAWHSRVFIDPNNTTLGDHRWWYIGTDIGPSSPHWVPFANSTIQLGPDAQTIPGDYLGIVSGTEGFSIGIPGASFDNIDYKKCQFLKVSNIATPILGSVKRIKNDESVETMTNPEVPMGFSEIISDGTDWWWVAGSHVSAGSSLTTPSETTMGYPVVWGDESGGSLEQGNIGGPGSFVLRNEENTIDLTDIPEQIVRTGELNDALASYVTATALALTLTGYADRAEVQGLINDLGGLIQDTLDTGYVSNSALVSAIASALTSYDTSTVVDGKIQNLADVIAATLDSGFLSVDTSPQLHGVPYYVKVNEYADISVPLGFGRAAQNFGGSAVAAANVIYFVPLYVSKAITVNELQMEITTLASDGNLRMGIFEDNPSDLGRPGNVLRQGTVSISTGGTGEKAVSFSSLALTPGLYWVGFGAQFSGTGTNPAFGGVSTGSSMVAESSPTAGISGFAYLKATISGTFVNGSGAAVARASTPPLPHIWLKRSA